MLIRAAILALATLGPISAPSAQDASVHQIQFRGSPGGGCPDGYDYNFSNGRCYPNEYRAPGAYRRDPYEAYNRPRSYGGCPNGYDFNYDRGRRCYPNGRRAPGTYAD